MRRSRYAAPFALLIALALGACGGTSTSSGTTTPTTPTPTPTTTETFSGDLNPNGAKTFSFAAAVAGTVTATLTTVSPDSTIAIGLSLGTWNGSACQIVLANDNAVQGAVLTGSVSAAGSLCARVYDVGKLGGNITFLVTLVHP